jgi:Amidohydrolase
MHIDPSAASTALRVMADQGIAVGLNASGGTPTRGLPESTALAASSGGRLRPYCNLELSRIVRPHFEDYIESVYEACKRAGGLGIKIPKSFGLSVFDNDGSLLRVDDPRADPIFDRAAAFGFPVLIHVGDPKAFFEPATPANERYAELQAHPNWSFSGLAPNGAPWPSWNDLLNAFERRIARHPQTKFLGAHFGNCAEEPERVDAWLDRYPNLFIDTAARVPEFGRHPADRMRAFFMKHRERVLFGSDLAVMPQGLVLGSNGRGLGREAEAADFFRAHWLYFETPTPRLRHPTPIQGNWTVDGVGLPREVLEKLYAGNALRLFNLQLPTPPREQNVARGN